MKFKIQTICQILLNILLAGNESDSTIEKIFKILKLVKEYSESFLPLVLPAFCRILMNCKNVQKLSFLKGIINYIQSILDLESTFQYLSNIIHSLINCIQDREEVNLECRDCILSIILAFREHTIIYLPLINITFKKKNLRNDAKFKIIIDRIKEYGDLQNLSELVQMMSAENTNRSLMSQDGVPQLQLSRQLTKSSAAFMTPQVRDRDKQKEKDTTFKLNDAIRRFNSEVVKNLFDISNNYLKEDWEEWLTKTSIELLLNSPSKVLYCCRSFANVNPSIAKDLFNIGFAMVWCQFNENQKSVIIQNLEKAIQNQNVPLTVLKTLLNLAEFMEHDNQGLQLDITSMANLAEKCNAHAKALYYREFEFNFSPDESIESLISLYSTLGQPEAASGMLVYAKDELGTKVKETWLEALGSWQEALDGYMNQEPLTPEDKAKNLKDKIRCYDALTQWELVLEKSDEFLKQNQDFSEVVRYASKAAIQLGKWELLEKYTEKINIRRDDANYYQSIINIYKKDYKAASETIKKSRKYIENYLVGINRQTYHNNYDKLVRLQILSELEEIIAFRDFQTNLGPETGGEVFNLEATNAKRLETKKKKDLLELWQDRLESTEKNIEHWLEIISVRCLLFRKSEMLSTMTRFAKLVVEKGNRDLCQRIFTDLEEELRTVQPVIIEPEMMETENLPPPIPVLTPSKETAQKFDFNDAATVYELPSEFYLSKFEKMYKLGELNNEQVYDCIQDFFKSVVLPPSLKAKYSRKLGSWLAQGLNEESQKGVGKVINLFKESIMLDNKVVKTWHLFALTNYKRIQQIMASKDKSTISDSPHSQGLLYLIKDACEGFIKSISIGGSEFTETLQDTLKLLELWFKFGDIPEIQKQLKDAYGEIDISCWLNVVPQMIAKLDIPNDIILENALNLLEYVGMRYPQGIVFQLILASQSNKERRKNSALGLIAKLREQKKQFVDDAETISMELQRVAILQQEEWLEFMDEAFKYMKEGNYQMGIQIMADLHKRTESDPESHNEILFYQKYGYLIKEAENYKQQYLRYNDVVAMYSVGEIYNQLFTSMREEMDSMQTVSIKVYLDFNQVSLSKVDEYQRFSCGHARVL